MKKLLSIAIFFSFITVTSGQITKNDLEKSIDKKMPYLEELYLGLHQSPELSLQENNTSEKMAGELKKLGFEVTEHVGGTSLFGIYKNGYGPVILLRTDMDALPVKEQTGLPYASNVVGHDSEGNEVSVMHACGHDIHMSVWVGTARTLVEFKDKWSGTLVFVAQSAEEMGVGSRNLIEAGLFDKIPRPDFNLAIHDDPHIPAGSVGICKGYAMANVDMVDVEVKGIGGHGAAPQYTVDPVVIASKIILNLQTIISRELSPFEPAVITVGKINGGTVGNIIPDHVNMELTVRTFGDDMRNEILSKMERTIKGTALSAGVPDSLMPVMTVKDQYTPSLYNNPELADKVIPVLKDFLGDKKVLDRKPLTAGEDFSRYGRVDPPIPSLMIWVGATDTKIMEEAENGKATIPPLHSPYFAPDYIPTIKTGVMALTVSVLKLMNKE